MRWPNGAKSAFALGFDMDGDTIWRNKTKTLAGGSGYIKGPSIGQYGTKKGALRVLEILDEFSLKSTWFIPANIVMEHPGLVETILDRGHEIGHHGWTTPGSTERPSRSRESALSAVRRYLRNIPAAGPGL